MHFVIPVELKYISFAPNIVFTVANTGMLLRTAFKVNYALTSVTPLGYMLYIIYLKVMIVYIIVKCVAMINSNTVDEDGGVANDSDSSPPQSRGRGRFEKGRGKVGSRGQSEDSRSTSSQAADEESSSHVRQHVCSRTESVKFT